MVKVLTVVGTRPECIRLSEIIKKLDQCVDHVLVHTGQSYDYEMSQIFFDELKIRKPDYQLEVKSATVGGQIGKILTQTEDVMLKEKPDAVLILGDTNSALSCIVAKRLKIPIFHMEAGNRSFDERVPEEINRRIVDHTSDINLAYTEHARRNLLAEGLPTQNIFVTGSPLPEVYYNHYGDIARAGAGEIGKLGLFPDKYMVASVHREENVENLDNVQAIIKAFHVLIDKYQMPIVFSVHPRTRKKIEENGWILEQDQLVLCKPFGLFNYISLQQNAFCVLTDSGTGHEDAAIFSLPLVIVRESQERPEAYDNGIVVISGVDPDNIIEAVKLARMQVDNRLVFSNPYGNDYNVSDKIVRLIVGLHKIIKKKEYYV